MNRPSFLKHFQLSSHLTDMSSSASSQQAWFTTGCSQGLGYELSKAVLAAGQKLLASSCNPSKSSETVAEIERLGGKWVTLDVASLSSTLRRWIMDI